MMTTVDDLEKSKQAGKFVISPDREVYGELTLAGPSTSLYLRDEENFNSRAINGQWMRGILHDLTKVTLVNCIITSGTGSFRRGDEGYFFAKFFPHFVLCGDHQIGRDERVITEVDFVVDDASTIFYDFDTFGSVIDAQPFIEQIIRAQHLNREVPTGLHPQILYFTGKSEIFSADTVLGKVSAMHNPNYPFGGPNGVALKNTIVTSIVFKEPHTFDETIADTLTLLKFLELLVGRPQNLFRLNVCLKSDDKLPKVLKVYWSMPPRRDPYNDIDKEHPQPADVLVNGGIHPEAFGNVLSNWVERHQAWHDARQRFSNSFSEQKRYGIDRLIGSANMFDILPDSAVPPEVPLSDELKCAREICAKMFRELPSTPERDSVLSTLGRVGKSTLKNKIRHRGKLLIDKVGERFPDLFTVADEAVNCRNHYVHGSEPRFDYTKEPDMGPFFTDTLEFIFAASDLVEAGWDIKAWSEIPTSMSHPFGRYRVDYMENLRELQSLL